MPPSSWENAFDPARESGLIKLSNCVRECQVVLFVVKIAEFVNPLCRNFDFHISVCCVGLCNTLSKAKCQKKEKYSKRSYHYMLSFQFCYVGAMCVKLAANGFGLCVRAGFGAQSFSLLQKFNISTTFQVCTSARLTQNPCYLLLFFFFSLVKFY
jgi:hypothetical protein